MCECCYCFHRNRKNLLYKFIDKKNLREELFIFIEGEKNNS